MSQNPRGGLPNIEKGSKLLYAISSDHSVYTPCTVLDIHFDDDPPYYTIQYYKMEETEGAAEVPRAKGSALKGGVVQDSPKKGKKLVMHEKQTTRARLRRRHEVPKDVPVL